MSVKIDKLNKRFGKQQVLHDISLSLPDTGVIGLLGPNGAGKSTLMKILVGIWGFDDGEVEVCGVDMRKNAHAVAQYVGYLPENNPLYGEMYVVEYLRLMAQLRGVENAKQRTEEVIDMVGLMPERHKRIAELSKGYKQRVGLAQAIVGQTKLLVLDEPTTGFDPNQLEDIRTLIRRMGEKQLVLLSTHVMQEVKAMCSRAIIIASGEIRADLTTLDDLDNLFHAVTHTQ